MEAVAEPDIDVECRRIILQLLDCGLVDWYRMLLQQLVEGLGELDPLFPKESLARDRFAAIRSGWRQQDRISDCRLSRCLPALLGRVPKVHRADGEPARLFSDVSIGFAADRDT